MNPASTLQLKENSAQLQILSGAPKKALDIDILRSVRMHRNVAIAVGAFVFLCILGFGLGRKPYYETSALIYVQPPKTKPVTSQSDGFDTSQYESFMQQQLQTVTRADVLAKAVESPAARLWKFPHEPEQLAVVRLQHSLKVDRVEQSFEIQISLSGNNPIAIAEMLNAVTTAYIRGEQEDEVSQSEKQLGILDEDRERINAELSADRKEQVGLSVSLGVADTSSTDNSNPFDAQLTELRSDLAKAVTAHDVAVAELASVRSGASNAADTLSAAANAIMQADPALSSFKQASAQRRSVLAGQMAGLTPQNPLYSQDQHEIDQLDQSVVEMETRVRTRAMKQVQQAREEEVRRTADIQSRLEQQLAAKTAIATSATPELQRANELTADITRLQARYSDVDNAISSIELSKDTAGSIHVLVPAVAPLGPKTSMKRLILAASLPLGILFGVAVAVLLVKLDPRVYVATDMSRSLGFYPLATLPEKDEVDKYVADEFLLRLLAGIDQVHRVDHCKSFLFTTASQGPAVHELMMSLARKMQRLGYSVATIRASELVQEKSLVTGSSGNVAIAGSSLGTGIPAGESFVSQKIELLERTADFVFIESLPLLSSSVAEFCARLADAVILIVESGHTTGAELKQSIGLVRRLHSAGLATVLYRMKMKNADGAFLAAVRSVEANRVRWADKPADMVSLEP